MTDRDVVELAPRRWAAPVLVGLPIGLFVVLAGLSFGGAFGGAAMGLLTLAGLGRWERSRRYVVARADGDGIHLTSFTDTLAVPWPDVADVTIQHGHFHASVTVTPTGEDPINLYAMGWRGRRSDVQRDVDRFLAMAAQHRGNAGP